jgi:hypothetical protein
MTLTQKEDIYKLQMLILWNKLAEESPFSDSFEPNWVQWIPCHIIDQMSDSGIFKGILQPVIPLDVPRTALQSCSY